MKPQNILQDGKTEASALLFAHDNKRSQEILLDSYTHDEEKRQGDLLERKHRDFIDFVTKDYISEMITETQVALEFVNQKERDSFTSSICNFVQSEEISELVEDTYPVLTGER